MKRLISVFVAMIMAAATTLPAGNQVAARAWYGATLPWWCGKIGWWAALKHGVSVVNRTLASIPPRRYDSMRASFDHRPGPPPPSEYARRMGPARPGRTGPTGLTQC